METRTSTASTAWKRAALTLALPLLGGCFSYVPTEPAAVPEGREVRVYLSRQAMDRLTEIPQAEGPVLRGTLVSRAGDALLVRVPVARRQEGFHVARIGQNVEIPTADIVAIERREIDRTGTALLVAGTAAAAATVIFVIVEGLAGQDGDDDDGGVEMRIPLLSFPFR